MTFIGRYYHALEQKGRLSIPVAFRSLLGDTAIITNGLDGCLFVFTQTEWQTIIGGAGSSITKKNSRDWERYLTNNAQEISFDAQGRILIPEYLRETAGLTKEVVIVGSLSRIELWDRALYHHYLDTVTTNVESIAESLETTDIKA